MTNYALDNIHIITQINLILLNICLAQLRKHKYFLNIRISLACTNFNLLRRLKLGGASGNYK